MFLPSFVCMYVNSGLHAQQGLFWQLSAELEKAKTRLYSTKLVGVDLFTFLFEILLAELCNFEPSSLSVSSSGKHLWKSGVLTSLAGHMKSDPDFSTTAVIITPTKLQVV